MAENGKSAWLDPRFIVTIVLLAGGWWSNNVISDYKIQQLEKEVTSLKELKIETSIALLRQDVATSNKLVQKIADKLGILSAD